MFDYYYGNEAEQFTFYRIPKLLITSPAFKKVSDSAKILYGLMLDRMGLSIKNGWFDDENRAYIFFTTKDVMEQMNCGTEKATKLLAELDSNKGVGLIERKKQGQGKPAILYLKKIIQVDKEKKSRLSAIESQDLGTAKYKTFDNRNSRVSPIEIADFRQSKCNDIKYNNTDFNDNELINPINLQEPVDMKRLIEERNQYKQLVKRNIAYDVIVTDYGAEWLDEIVMIMVDIICSRSPTVRINKEDYPHELVKNRFLKITDEHIEYIYFALKQNTTEVRNIRAFLITTIFRAIETCDNWYSSKVAHDLRKNNY